MILLLEVLVKSKMMHCQLKVLAAALHQNEMPIGVDHPVDIDGTNHFITLHHNEMPIGVDHSSNDQD